MTVAALGAGEGRLQSVTAEQPGDHGEMLVDLRERVGVIHADLTVGPNLTNAQTLQADCNLSSPGVKLHGAGFIVTPEQAAALLPTPTLPTRGEGATSPSSRNAGFAPPPTLRGRGWEGNPLHREAPSSPPHLPHSAWGGEEEEIVRPCRIGRDLTDAPRGVPAIDLFGLSAEQVRSRYPAVYQWLLERVKPERDQNQRDTYRDN